MALKFSLTPSKHVVIDPNRAFGSPLIDEAGVSTQALHREWDRYRDVKYVGRLYDIDVTLVRDAVQYEQRLTQAESAAIGQSII